MRLRRLTCDPRNRSEGGAEENSSVTRSATEQDHEERCHCEDRRIDLLSQAGEHLFAGWFAARVRQGKRTRTHFVEGGHEGEEPPRDRTPGRMSGKINDVPEHLDRRCAEAEARAEQRTVEAGERRRHP